jgi:hypothetical protein
MHRVTPEPEIHKDPVPVLCWKGRSPVEQVIEVIAA